MQGKTKKKEHSETHKSYEENKKRCFISINIPKEVSNKIEKIQNSLPDFNGKKTETENLHLTLKFLGEIKEEEIDKIKDILRNIKFSKFELRAGELGAFSPKFIRIIWLHLIGGEELQKKIDKEISTKFEKFGKEKRFMSHLTIARVKSLKGENKENFLEKLNSIEIPQISFCVQEFCLMSSELTPEGAKHRVIERFGLVD